MSSKGRIRTLDLFHGAGGSSYGAMKAGADIIAGIDSWSVASETYKRNFPGARVILDDIRNVTLKSLKSMIGDIDLIIASPECTNHTCAKGAADRCEDSKMTAFQVIRYAKEFKPKWIVVENVIQMKSWSRHQELLEQLWNMGYFVKEQVVNAKDFGVPQSRKRLFLICSLSGESNDLRKRRGKLKPAHTVINEQADYGFNPLYTPKRAIPTIERADRAISAIGNKEPFLIVYYGSDGSGGWQSLDKPLRTITTLDRFAYVKPSKQGHMMRMLQPDELKKAMGFDLKFILDKGTRRDKIKLMGNAVCPPVMKRIVKSVVE